MALYPDISILTPPAHTFDTPGCYSMGIDSSNPDGFPSDIIWPDSYTLSIQFVAQQNIQNMYNNAITQTYGIQEVLSHPYLPDYSLSLISTPADRLFYVLNWIPITPTPCFFQPSPNGPFVDMPNVTQIGHVSFADSNLDVYTTISNLWLFSGLTPVAIVLPELQDIPKTPLPLNFTAGTPPDSVFSVPDVCYPWLVNTTMFQKRADLAVPTFPLAFTMYIVAPSIRSAEIVYYVDLANQYFRIDYPGYTLVQKYGVLYTYLTEVTLTPPICYNVTQSDPLIKLPVFSKRLGNATIDTIQVAIWAGISDPLDLPLRYEYWYINPLTNVPHFFMDSNLLGAKVTLFESFIQNPNTFNSIPPVCNGSPILKSQLDALKTPPAFKNHFVWHKKFE